MEKKATKIKMLSKKEFQVLLVYIKKEFHVYYVEKLEINSMISPED
jgi:hypothetical protein